MINLDTEKSRFARYFFNVHLELEFKYILNHKYDDNSNVLCR